MPLRKLNDKAAESAEQDQTARMCRLILIYALRKSFNVCERQDQVKES